MTGLSKILRFWLLLPIIFITVAAVLVTAVLTWRIYRLEIADRVNQKLAIESQLYADSAKIAEELYLKLDNISTREQQLARILSNRGTTVKLKFEPSSQKDANEHADQQIIRWTASDGVSPEESARMPLRFGDMELGDLVADVTWTRGWQLGGVESMLAKLALVVGLVIATWIVTFHVFKRRIFQPLVENMMKMSRWEAAAEATQMIAHDVRKPFHLMRLSLAAIQCSSDPAEIKRIAQASLNKVDKLSTEVEGLLQDMLDLDRLAEVKVEPIGLLALVNTRISLTGKVIAEKNVDLSVSIDPDLRVAIDPLRMSRVITNILQNALQAIEPGERIWIRAGYVIGSKDGSFVTVCIGNSGRAIPANDLPMLFDRFFTKGKVDGTGLGLAIAKKFVVAHGGRIWCMSSQQQGTEFLFTMPVVVVRHEQI